MQGWANYPNPKNTSPNPRNPSPKNPNTTSGRTVPEIIIGKLIVQVTFAPFLFDISMLITVS